MALLRVLRVLRVLLLCAALAPMATPNLVFTPTGGKIQLIMGFGIPVDLPHQAVTMGYVIKSNYLTPFNATQFTRPLEAFAQRGARSVAENTIETETDDVGHDGQLGFLGKPLASRWHLYGALQVAVEQMGAGRGSGRQCLLRAVCEAAAYTLHHDGLLGELMHVVLTPSSTNEPVVQHEDYEFHAAERAGRQARDAKDPVDICYKLFPGCKTGTLDLFTRMLPF